MADVGYVLLMIGFVVLAVLFVIGCDKIIGPDDIAMGGEEERDDAEPLIDENGKLVGSALLGQSFADAKGNPLPQYFQPRPSASGYNGSDSAASNLGPSNPVLINEITERSRAYRAFNGLPANAAIPVDAVTASASGLDPDISVQNALDQAPRVARARHVPVARVLALVHQYTTGAQWGFLSEPMVNVLELNLALDGLR